MVGDCGFMGATLYAKSIFGEDALANLSIEKSFENPSAPVTGHIRIRAKSQVMNGAFKLKNINTQFLFNLKGMALSLGDKINSSQKRGGSGGGRKGGENHQSPSSTPLNETRA